ncbi:uncharacterized protein LOC128884028 isoform X3 [Hylaeus volcanicus]|uniref:uncharacterized protein LOC128884028 isoform X3 n=1 Tax=Hylaeus volcanicus TaxID=313075 RepID=UPI0023B81D86|nr:uncharacterized protein LOC128884028 isoform X3 [Hylaeus volcanicus]
MYNKSLESPNLVDRCNPSWYGTCFRVKNMEESVAFYVQNFHMRLIEQKTENEDVYSVLISPKQSDVSQISSCMAVRSLLQNTVSLNLRYSNNQDDAAYEEMNNGNVEPYRGFGHIAFNCNSVDETCEKLESQGVRFHKRPNEGRMKGLAFALDPSGYWIEIVGRGKTHFPEEFNFSQTMIRVKDPQKSLQFYRDVLGMHLVREMHMSDFSNYFLAYLPESFVSKDDRSPEEQREFVHSLWNPCLELTHNHGTENNAEFHYHNGNTPPVGFSHLSFHLDNLGQFKEVTLQKCIHMGSPKKCQCKSSMMVWIQDPDGYYIKLVDRKSIT